MLALALAVLLAPSTIPTAPDRTALRDPAKIRAATRKGEGGRPVANLPHANGRTFHTLDAYLAWLRDHAAPVDLPWYREVRPGVFRRESHGRVGSPPREFTRDDLARKFGFAPRSDARAPL